MAVKVKKQEEIYMQSPIRSLPSALQAELEYTQLVCPDIEVYPVEDDLFQLYYGGEYPKKDPMPEGEIIRWLDGFREGLLHHLKRATPPLPSGTA